MGRADVVRLDIGGTFGSIFKGWTRLPWTWTPKAEKAVNHYKQALDVWFSH
jgi:hypothetical protein